MKITAVIPVYREPEFLADIVKKLSSDSHADKEIIVAIDGKMTRSIRDALNSVRADITLYYPRRHLGKAALLNGCVKQLNTDVLLFLDNDVLLPENRMFLSTIAGYMENHDIVEMPKEVIVRSPYSAMISYEYLNFTAVNYILSKIARRSPGLIGSAFAVKKGLFDELNGFMPVIHEDGDFAARAFMRDARYTYPRLLAVKTSMPDTSQEWFKQRKRWALINILWLEDNIACLAKALFKSPGIIPVLFLLLLPVINMALITVLLDKTNLLWLLPHVFINISSLNFLSGIFLWLTNYMLLSGGILFFGLSFLVSSLLTWLTARAFNFRFNLFDYFLYYTVYAPVLVLANIFIMVLHFADRDLKIEWKTGGSRGD
ncbi:MAG: glycosyltransferase family 2 protein [Spirochaetia bacterium]|nr:glycosyltransferase family 2 protein [Spirochaetia bacterium]